MDSSFINQDAPDGYSIYFKSPLVNGFQDAQIICLPELHHGFGAEMKKQNAHLIDSTIENLASKKILVLVENVKSLHDANQNGHEQVMLCRKILEVKGWDLGSVSEFLPLSTNLLKSYTNVEKTVEKWHTISRPFLIEDSSCDQFIMQKIMKAKNEVDVIKNQFQIEHGKEWIDNFDNAVKAIFQSRNNQMIETLMKVIPLYDTIFVISGILHFIPTENNGTDDFLSQPEFDTTPLHDFLRTQKAVILNHTAPSPCTTM